MMIEKKKLRQWIQKELSKVSVLNKEKYEEQIRNHLFNLDEWKNAETIGITVSRGNEINTFRIIEKAWEEGKTICVPKCNPEDFSMNFRKLLSYEELETVYFGLKEPIVSKTELIQPEQVNLLVVPGLLYDQDGFRIGFGGGYFDRYLAHFTNAKISLLYNTQLIERVPREMFDIPVDKLVLPDGIISINETNE